MNERSRKSSGPKLVGRSDELAKILERVERAGTAYVTGSAGIGKTVLLYEAGRQLTESGMEVIVLSGHEATSVIPLAPLLRLCPPGVDDAGSAIIGELYRRSRRGRVAVSVDDAHLLDRATSAVVRQIAGADDIGLILAVRSGEEVPPEIESIATDRLSETVELGPFDRETTAQLVEQALGLVDSVTSDWLWQQSQGHPLYLREMLIAARETGALRREGGSWRAVEGPVWTARLHALIARRLAELDPEARRAVESVAVAGDLAVDIISRISSLDDLAELDRRQILSLSDGVARIQHPLFAESVLAGMDPERTDQLRLSIARAIDESDGRDPVRSLALRLEADAEVDRRELVEGTRLALQLRLPRVAEGFARAALDSGVDADTTADLASALAMQRRWDDAEQRFEEAVELADTGHEAGLFEGWLRLNFEYRDDPQEAMDQVPRAREVVGGRMSPDLEMISLRTEMFLGNLDDAISSHEEYRTAHDLAERHRLMVDVGIATSGSQSGAFDGARELARRWRHVDELDPVEFMRLQAVGVLSHAWLAGPRVAMDEIDALVDRAERSDDPDLVVLANIYAGMSLNEALRPEEALPPLRRVIEATRSAHHRRHVGIAEAEVARALSSLEGPMDEAQRMIDRAMDLADGPRWLAEAPAMLAQSRIDRIEGRDPHAALQRGLRIARARSARAHEVFLLRESAYLGRAREVADAVSMVASGMDGVMAKIIDAEASALAAADADALDRVAGRAEELGVLGIAFDASVLATNLHRTAEHLRYAMASEWRARRILNQSPRYLSPAREQWEPVLSDREYEVVERVVGGDSSREAAAVLFVSPRTIDSHLRRIYRRLDLSSREELAEVVSAAGPPPSATPS